MRVFLETERLLLRQFTEADADDLFALYDDPAVMRFLNGGKPADRAEIENIDLPAFLGYYERFPGYGFWAAIKKSSGAFLGWFHFRPKPEYLPDDLKDASAGHGTGSQVSPVSTVRASPPVRSASQAWKPSAWPGARPTSKWASSSKRVACSR